MYVKMYTYHVRPERVNDYLIIQKRADLIYSKFVLKHSFHLNNRDEPSKWVEIHQYESEEHYREAITKINTEQEMNELFVQFLDVLIPHTAIVEEDYRLIDTDLN